MFQIFGGFPPKIWNIIRARNYFKLNPFIDEMFTKGGTLLKQSCIDTII